MSGSLAAAPSRYRSAPLVDVQVDAEQDQRPEHGRQESRGDLLQAVQLRPVVVRARHDPAGNEIHDDEQAEARTCSRCAWSVITHLRNPLCVALLLPCFEIRKRPGQTRWYRACKRPKTP